MNLYLISTWNSDQCDIKFVIRINREHGQNKPWISVNRNHFNLKCCQCYLLSRKAGVIQLYSVRKLIWCRRNLNLYLISTWNSDQCDIKFVIRINREHGQNKPWISVNRNHFNLKCCQCYLLSRKAGVIQLYSVRKLIWCRRNLNLYLISTWNSDQCDIKFVIRINREHGQIKPSNSVNRNHFNSKCNRR